MGNHLSSIIKKKLSRRQQSGFDLLQLPRHDFWPFCNTKGMELPHFAYPSPFELLRNVWTAQKSIFDIPDIHSSNSMEVRHLCTDDITSQSCRGNSHWFPYGMGMGMTLSLWEFHMWESMEILWDPVGSSVKSYLSNILCTNIPVRAGEPALAMMALLRSSIYQNIFLK